MLTMMSDKDAARFVAALDKVDSAFVAIRMEFEALAKESADRLVALMARELDRARVAEHRDAAPA